MRSIHTPSDGKLFQTLKSEGQAELDAKVLAADQARTAPGSREALQKTAREVPELLRSHERELAALLAHESGLPLRDCLQDIKDALGEKPLPAWAQTPELFVQRCSRAQVWRVRLPWQAPVGVFMAHAWPKLREGDVLLFEGTPHATLVTLALAQMLRESPLAPELVPTWVPELSQPVATSKPTAYFAGEDTDVPTVAPLLAAAALKANGQDPHALKIIVAHKEVASPLALALCRETRARKVGHPLAEDTELGPLASMASRDATENAVKEAVRADAILLSGGKRIAGPGFYFEQTVLRKAPLHSALWSQSFEGPFIVMVEAKQDADLEKFRAEHADWNWLKKF